MFIHQSDYSLHLQGELQVVFNALYELGVIEPVLQKDWKPHLSGEIEGSARKAKAIEVANRFASDQSRLVVELRQLDRDSLEVLAMEVAREYAEFHSRRSLH